MPELRDWRESKELSQADMAKKLGVPRPTYQKMEAGTGPIDSQDEAKLRKLGFDGLLPRQEAKEAAKAPAGDFATREELWKLAGRVEALEKRLETAFEQLRDLYLRGPKESRQGEPPR